MTPPPWRGNGAGGWNGDKTPNTTRVVSLAVSLTINLGVLAAIVVPTYLGLSKLPLPSERDRWGGVVQVPHTSRAVAEPRPDRAQAARRPRATRPSRRPKHHAPSVSGPAAGEEAPPTIAEIDGSQPGESATADLAGASSVGRGAGIGVGSITPPKPVSNYAHLKIPYTPEATRRSLRGVIRVELQVDATGRVTSVRLLRGVGFGMDSRAIELAHKFRFLPARDPQGRPFPCRITWSFELNG